MKRIIAGLLVVGILAGSVEARSIQHTGSESQAGGSSGVPVVAIVGAVITAGLILFKVRQVKRERAARFNVYMVRGS